MSQGFVAFVGLIAIIAAGIQLWRRPLIIAHAGLGAGAGAIVYGGGASLEFSAATAAVVFGFFLGLQLFFGAIGYALDWIMSRLRRSKA